MRCHEFVDELNRLLDQRGSDCAALLEHTRNCPVCRQAWESFQRCERSLAQSNLVADEGLTDRVLRQTKRRSQEHRRRKWMVLVSFVATTAAGLLALAAAFSNPTQELELETRDHRTSPGSVAAGEPPANWSQWYANTELPSVNELWNLRWPNDDAHASVTQSVSSGLRPVAETVGWAFKVIRQNLLPATPPPGSDGQAGRDARFVAIV